MVREIIHVQVGQCGNQIGNVFWDNMRIEHHLSQNGTFIPSSNTEYEIKETSNNNSHHNNRNSTLLYSDDFARLDKINVYFKEVSSHHRYVPRATLIDLEPATLDTIKSSTIGSMFSPDNFVFGSSGAGNNWLIFPYVCLY